MKCLPTPLSWPIVHSHANLAPETVTICPRVQMPVFTPSPLNWTSSLKLFPGVCVWLLILLLLLFFLLLLPHTHGRPISCLHKILCWAELPSLQSSPVCNRPGHLKGERGYWPAALSQILPLILSPVLCAVICDLRMFFYYSRFMCSVLGLKWQHHS